MNNEDKIFEALAMINNRLDGIDDKFDRIEKKINSINERLDSMDVRFNKVDNRLDVIDARLDGIESGQLTLTAEVSAIRFSVERLENRLDEIESKNALRHMEIQQSYQQQYNTLENIVKDNTYDIAKLKAAR